MSRSKLVEVNEKIAENVTEGFNKMSDAVVGGYTKIEDKFVDRYLRKENETVEEAKERFKAEEKSKKRRTEKSSYFAKKDCFICERNFSAIGEKV